VIKHKYDCKVAPELIYNINKVTRENNFRLSKNRSYYDFRKFSFTNRIVNIWNSLPRAVVNVDSVDLYIIHIIVITKTYKTPLTGLSGAVQSNVDN